MRRSPTGFCTTGQQNSAAMAIVRSRKPVPGLGTMLQLLTAQSVDCAVAIDEDQCAGAEDPEIRRRFCHGDAMGGGLGASVLGRR